MSKFNIFNGWAVDLTACCVSHESGLYVNYEAHPDAKRAGDNVISWQRGLTMSGTALDEHTKIMLQDADQMWEDAAGNHVALYIKKCTDGISVIKDTWKIKVPNPQDALERWALDSFLDEVRAATGVKPNFEIWN